MKNLFEVCNEISPITVPAVAFMSGYAIANEMYVIGIVIAIIVIANIPFLKSK